MNLKMILLEVIFNLFLIFLLFIEKKIYFKINYLFSFFIINLLFLKNFFFIMGNYNVKKKKEIKHISMRKLIGKNECQNKKKKIEEDEFDITVGIKENDSYLPTLQNLAQKPKTRFISQKNIKPFQKVKKRDFKIVNLRKFEISLLKSINKYRTENGLKKLILKKKYKESSLKNFHFISLKKELIDFKSFKKLKKEILSEKKFSFLVQNIAFVTKEHKIIKKSDLAYYLLNIWKQSMGDDMNLKTDAEECVISIFISSDRNITVSVFFLKKI